jgi:hypothetical protein
MPSCSVDGCERRADVEARLYDVYHDGRIFDEQDHTCPYLCAHHVQQNEAEARGERKPRGMVRYPYTNSHSAQGFTIYRPLIEEDDA